MRSSYRRGERWDGAMEIVAVTSLVDLPINDSSPSPPGASHPHDAPSTPLVSPSSRVSTSSPLVSPSSPSHSRAAASNPLVSRSSADAASHSANEPAPPQDSNHHRWLLDGVPDWSTGGRLLGGSRGAGAGGSSSVRKTLASIICASLVIGAVAWVAIAVWRRHSGKREALPPPDAYAIALRQALLFFNAQRSGPLPQHNNVSWRRNSGMRDGLSDPAFGRNLVGGFYDDGSAMKITFPASFAMTMLSWSVIEYSPKYEAVGELDHVKGIIKWGIDYLLKTFNSSATTIDGIVAQVGHGSTSDKQPNDHYCWMRPEEINYPRPVRTCFACPELSAEMAASLAAASIVFKDSKTYSEMLVLRAEALWKFARKMQDTFHSDGIGTSTYNSSGFWDEFMWGGAWLYYATGNTSYLSSLATDLEKAKQDGLKMDTPERGVLSWDNKFPGAEVLMSRLRLFLSPGYPLEELLRMLHNQTDILMCSYLPDFTSFSRTKGGLLRLNRRGTKPLQYVVNVAFLASLYSDYLEASDIPGWYCGPTFYSIAALRSFAKAQINYILGENPQKMSYVVGYSDRYPKHVHHRGASIPNSHVSYTCEGGWKWRDSRSANPNTLIGAMVSGPDKNDGFQDVRSNPNYTEPTLAGNAGLVAALVSLSVGSNMLDRNAIFSNLRPAFQASPPPSKLWKP